MAGGSRGGFWGMRSMLLGREGIVTRNILATSWRMRDDGLRSRVERDAL